VGTSSGNFALVRYNPDGRLDKSFDGDGIVTTLIALSAGDRSVTVQTDGKILVAGTSSGKFSLLRYNPDGSLDKSFDGDGIVTTPIGLTAKDASVTVQADGKILVAGGKALVRYNPDGSLDTTFDPLNTLGGTVSYAKGSVPVVLDNDVQIVDAELAKQGHYNGASLTLARNRGASAEDVFSSANFSGANLVVSGITIGTVSQSTGSLSLKFNSSATQALVNQALQSIEYSNQSPASVKIDWTFSDGNSGTQGSGGASTTTGHTIVNITAPSPIIGSIGNDFLVGTKGADQINGLDGADTLHGGEGNDSLRGGAGDDILDGGLGLDFLNGGTGNDTADYTYATSNLNITLDSSGWATVNVGMGDVDTLAAIENLIGGSGNDILTGNSLANVLKGGAGNDILNGGKGNDILTGGAGADTFVFSNIHRGDVNKDIITDFNRAEGDKIKLTNVFTAFSGMSAITNANLVIGSEAADTNDFLIYNPTTEQLFYDADGIGNQFLNIAPVEIAIIGNKPAWLLASDFIF